MEISQDLVSFKLDASNHSAVPFSFLIHRARLISRSTKRQYFMKDSN